MQVQHLADQMQMRRLELENQNLRKQYDEEVAKNTNLIIKVKSIETSQAFADKYVYLLWRVVSQKPRENLLFINNFGLNKLSSFYKNIKLFIYATDIAHKKRRAGIHKCISVVRVVPNNKSVSHSCIFAVLLFFLSFLQF